MERKSPRIRSLLRQADRVADSGKRAAAEKLYRQIIEEAPDTAGAWVGLGQVLHVPAEKESSFQQALELEPENAKAIAGLARLSGNKAPGDIEENGTSLEDVSDNGGNRAESSTIDMAVSDTVSEFGNESTEVAPALSQKTEEHDHHVVATSESQKILYCANHPNRETYLRCNRCDKPICSSCAKRTPVGYRCPECIREQEDVFFNATAMDYVVTIVVAIPLSLIAGWIATFLGIFSIFLGAAAGSLIGRLSFRAAGRRRGRGMPQIVAAIVVIGAIIPVLPAILQIFSGAAIFNFRIIFTGIYIVTATGAAYYQMR